MLLPSSSEKSRTSLCWWVLQVRVGRQDPCAELLSDQAQVSKISGQAKKNKRRRERCNSGRLAGPKMNVKFILIIPAQGETWGVFSEHHGKEEVLWRVGVRKFRFWHNANSKQLWQPGRLQRKGVEEEAAMTHRLTILRDMAFVLRTVLPFS